MRGHGFSVQPGAGKTTLSPADYRHRPKEGTIPLDFHRKDDRVRHRGGDSRRAVQEGGRHLFPRERVRLHTEADVRLAAAAAIIFEKGGTATAASRLLEHSEQRFRLSYLLGNVYFPSGRGGRTV